MNVIGWHKKWRDSIGCAQYVLAGKQPQIFKLLVYSMEQVGPRLWWTSLKTQVLYSKQDATEVVKKTTWLSYEQSIFKIIWCLIIHLSIYLFLFFLFSDHSWINQYHAWSCFIVKWHLFIWSDDNFYSFTWLLMGE